MSGWNSRSKMVEQTITEKLQALERDAQLYRNMRGRYVEYAKQLREAIKVVEGVIKDLDPVVKEGRSNTSHEDEYRELYDLMVKGSHISSDFLATTYGWPYWTVQGAMKTLAKMPGIERRKEGVRVFLYHREHP